MLLNRFKYNRQNKNQEILKKFCKIYYCFIIDLFIYYCRTQYEIYT